MSLSNLFKKGLTKNMLKVLVQKVVGNFGPTFSQKVVGNFGPTFSQKVVGCLFLYSSLQARSLSSSFLIFASLHAVHNSSPSS